MTDMVLQKNVASLLTVRGASAFVSDTAGGAGDATAVVGTAIQRTAIGLPMSAALVIAYAATLAATKSLSIGSVVVQDSADGTTWANYQTFTDPGIVDTTTGASAGQVVLPVNLEGARDYIRAGFTPDLSNTGTDTATIVALFVFAGERLAPAVA